MPRYAVGYVSVEPDAFYQLLGRRIEDARRAKGLTQAAVGSRLRPPHTRASISNIEKGAQRILVHTLVQLAEALGVQAKDFLPTRAVVEPSAKDVERVLREKLGLPKKELKRIVAQLGERKE